jgi:hypothetical protein
MQMYGSTIAFYKNEEAATMAAKAFRLETNIEYIVVQKTLDIDRNHSINYYKAIEKDDLEEAKKDGYKTWKKIQDISSVIELTPEQNEKAPVKEMSQKELKEKLHVVQNRGKAKKVYTSEKYVVRTLFSLGAKDVNNQIESIESYLMDNDIDFSSVSIKQDQNDIYDYMKIEAIFQTKGVKDEFIAMMSFYKNNNDYEYTDDMQLDIDGGIFIIQID